MERIFLLDRSGSMESCRDDTIGGFNAFVNSQKSLGGTMTLILFDHEVTSVYENVDIDKVEPLTTDTFVPRGSTSLLDALGHVLKMPVNGKQTVIILTDGEENSSTKYSELHIKDLIEQKKDWDFVYLGANQDTILNATRLGIRTSYGFETQKTPELFRALSTAMSTGAPITPGHSQIA